LISKIEFLISKIELLRSKILFLRSKIEFLISKIQNNFWSQKFYFWYQQFNFWSQQFKNVNLGCFTILNLSLCPWCVKVGHMLSTRDHVMSHEMSILFFVNIHILLRHFADVLFRFEFCLWHNIVKILPDNENISKQIHACEQFIVKWDYKVTNQNFKNHRNADFCNFLFLTIPSSTSHCSNVLH